MELKQKTELRKLLVPELRQSLRILALPLPDLGALVEEELLNNPCLEETAPQKTPASPLSQKGFSKPDLEFRLNLITKKPSLQDVLLRQLGMFTNTDEDFRVGQEIIGNIDENGYLKSPLEEIAATLNITPDKAEAALKVIQDFEPAGVGAKTIAECLLIQLKQAGEKDPLLLKLVEGHLEDIAKKKYSHIAKTLKEPEEKIELLIKKILKLDPKPGRNYSVEETQRITPDITIDTDTDEEGGELEITINDEDLPTLSINKAYKEMLKNNQIDPQAKAFLTDKLRNALELLRAISKRKFTLRKIVETIADIQQEAIRSDLSRLKPLTFNEVAQKINMHESTVCRAVMNKYVKVPCGIVALKDFFSSHVQNQNGESVSSSFVKGRIKELIDKEGKKHPLSDRDISALLLKEHNLNVSRRTVAKYREELKILSSAFRKER